MRLILDTHALLWWLVDDPKLSREARRLLEDKSNAIYVSTASAWEIATKVRIGKLPGARFLPVELPEIIDIIGFLVFAIDLQHALLAGSIVAKHRDPFDRMLAAQSILENIPIVTNDPALKALGAAVVW